MGGPWRMHLGKLCRKGLVPQTLVAVHCAPDTSVAPCTEGASLSRNIGVFACTPPKTADAISTVLFFSFNVVHRLLLFDCFRACYTGMSQGILHILLFASVRRAMCKRANAPLYTPPALIAVRLFKANEGAGLVPPVACVASLSV